MPARVLVYLVALLSVVSLPAIAGEADVVKVDVRESGRGNYTFNVTVLHADAGWDHYADKWEILSEDGTLLGTRILHHPHVDEQPFTRSLTGVKIPDHLDKVTVRAHDRVHEYGGKVISVDVKGRD